MSGSSGTIIRIALQFLRAIRKRQQAQAANNTNLSKPPPEVKTDPGDIPPDKAHIEYDEHGNPTLVLPEMTIYGDNGTPSKVGTPFPSPTAAASAALKEIYGPTMDGNVEYAGNIYRTPDGQFSFSPPVTQGSDHESNAGASPVPAGANVVGTYHSHAAGFNETDELFSPTDKLKATLGRDTSYLLTPRGQLFQYTPVNLLSPADQHRFPQGRVSRIS